MHPSLTMQRFKIASYWFLFRRWFDKNSHLCKSHLWQQVCASLEVFSEMYLLMVVQECIAKSSTLLPIFIFPSTKDKKKEDTDKDKYELPHTQHMIYFQMC